MPLFQAKTERLLYPGESWFSKSIAIILGKEFLRFQIYEYLSFSKMNTDGEFKYDQVKALFDDDLSSISSTGESTLRSKTTTPNTKEDVFMVEVGDINCYCLPVRVYGIKDFMYRTVGWTILNKEQILSAFTGKIDFLRFHFKEKNKLNESSIVTQLR